jgi:hypothetical protein
MRVILLLLLLVAPALSFDNGQYQNVDPKIRSWFESIKSPNGGPCCSIADGHPTDYEHRADGYWIPTPELPASHENWMKVPPESIVYSKENPVGMAVVWYVPYRNAPPNGPTVQWYIRCFIAGSEW